MKLKKGEYHALQSACIQRIEYFQAYLWQHMDEEGESIVRRERELLTTAWEKIEREYKLQRRGNSRKGQSVD